MPLVTFTRRYHALGHCTTIRNKGNRYRKVANTERERDKVEIKLQGDDVDFAVFFCIFGEAAAAAVFRGNCEESVENEIVTGSACVSAVLSSVSALPHESRPAEQTRRRSAAAAETGPRLVLVLDLAETRQRGDLTWWPRPFRSGSQRAHLKRCSRFPCGLHILAKAKASSGLVYIYFLANICVFANRLA